MQCGSYEVVVLVLHQEIRDALLCRNHFQRLKLAEVHYYDSQGGQVVCCFLF